MSQNPHTHPKSISYVAALEKFVPLEIAEKRQIISTVRAQAEYSEPLERGTNMKEKAVWF